MNMMRGTLAAAALVMCALAVSRPAARQTFRAGTDVVRVPVVVTGRAGEPVRGLTREDFDLREEGRPQRLEFFAEGAPGGALPLHLGLLLDTSESMQQDLADAMTASIQFVNAVEESVDVTLVDFDSVVRISRFAPASYPQLFERIRSRKASGMTALYDATGAYIEEAIVQGGQHVLIMYTDGGDSSSSLGIGRLLDLLRLASNVIVYPIGYLGHQRGGGRLEQQMRLGQIARETGGAAFFPGSAREVRGIYDRILRELTSRYTVGYVSSNDAADGRFRKLEVRVTRPGVRDLKVRARTGYYAPLQRQ
jgi:Ca-activated chloride channel family protein